METYQYGTLQSEDSIRLLEVHRSRLPFSKSLFFSLKTVLLSRLPKFEALSYVWGSSERSTTIKNQDTGEVLHITNNCFSALYDLCGDGQRRLFVDQICINQNDVHERTQQVALMGKIYQQALRTIVYLGELDEHSDYILRYRKSRRYDRAVDKFEVRPAWSKLLKCGMLPTHDQWPLANHLQELASKPWFTRTWTIQELLLAREGVVRVGRKNLEWAFLLSEIQRLWPESKLTSPSPVFPAILNFYGRNIGPELIYPSNKRHPSGRGTKFERLPYKEVFAAMCQTSDCNCADPRDRLFALTTLFDGPQPTELVPNYSRSLVDVYVGVTRYALRTLIDTDPCDIVLTKALGLSDPRSSLPTWSIDWTRIGRNWRFVEKDIERAKRIHRIDNDYRLNLFERNVKRVLRLRGIRFGRIKSAPLERIPLGRPNRTKEMHHLLGWYPVRASFTIEQNNCETPSSHESNPEKIYRAQARRETCVGDYTCFFLGFDMPYILRKLGDTWRFVGECWPEEWYVEEEEMPTEDAIVPEYMRDLQMAIRHTSKAWFATQPPSPLEDFDII